MFRLDLVTIVFLSIVQFAFCGRPNDVEVVFQWKILDFGFPSNHDRDQAIAGGNLVPSNAIPIDVEAHYNNRGKSRVFTTVPRFSTGIPYTLATVTEQRRAAGSKGPLLQPYPSYEWHTSHGSNCEGITSAFRMAITECGGMWVIDSGNIGGVQHCPPQLLLFDLNTDQLVHRYRFDSSLYTANASLFITPVVMTRDPPPKGRCKQSMIYVADVSFHGLVVYDLKENVAWRVENKYMYPDPDYGTLTVAGDSFELMDGIFGMSTDKCTLYFHPLAGVREYAVPLSVLDNRATWEHDTEAMPHEFRPLGTRGSQCAAEAMDSRGNLYCVTLNPIKLISWNVNTPFKSKNLRDIQINPRLLEFVSGMKVVFNTAGKEELWMMSNRFQKLASGTQSFEEVNFRIVKYVIDELQNSVDTGSSDKDLHNRLVFT